MNDQLELVDVEVTPKLTVRQQAVLDAVHNAGIEGLDTDQAGAVAHELKTGQWRHGRDDRCAFCGKDGKQILERLRDRGLVRYRRAKGQTPGGWLPSRAANSKLTGDPPPDHAGDGPVPYGAFPEGF